MWSPRALLSTVYRPRFWSSGAPSRMRALTTALRGEGGLACKCSPRRPSPLWFPQICERYMGGLPRPRQPPERDRGVSGASAAAAAQRGGARAQRLPSTAVQLHTARCLAPVQEWPRPAATPTRWAQLAPLQLVRHDLRAHDGARAPPHCLAAVTPTTALRPAAVRRCHIAVTSPPRCDLFTASRSLPCSRSQLPCSPSQVQSSLRDSR